MSVADTQKNDLTFGAPSALPNISAARKVGGPQGSDWRMADGDEDRDNDAGHLTGLATKQKPKTKRPSKYRVLLLNDDYTPMEFVVMILQDVFNKNAEESWEIMMHVHKQGVGECGVFPYEVAETKVTRVMDAARKHEHPLQCVMEKS